MWELVSGTALYGGDKELKKPEAGGVRGSSCSLRRISAMCQGELQAASMLIAEGERPQGKAIMKGARA